MSAHAGVMNRSSRKTADAIHILVFRPAPGRIHSVRGIKVPRSASTAHVSDPCSSVGRGVGAVPLSGSHQWFRFHFAILALGTHNYSRFPPPIVERATTALLGSS